jgi:4-amino-4-deoxy-L-arabinose transferase-like glycosyltransferase
MVLSIPTLLWFARNWRVSPDSSWYLLLGSNLIAGHGYTNLVGGPEIQRGPVFPGLLGLLMLFLGRDVESLAWTVRLLAIVNPLLMYFLIRRISGPVAGLLAAALVTLFGYIAALPISLNIDAVMLTVYLLSFLTLLAAVQKDSALLSLLSGLLLGISILTKETALAGLPLGLLAVLLLGWRARRIFPYYLGVALVCLPWWTWVWSVSGEVYLVGTLSGTPAYLLTIAFCLLGIFIVLLYVSGVLERFLANERLRRRAGWALLIVWVVSLSALLSTSADLTSVSTRDVTTYLTGELARNTPLWFVLPLAGAYVAWKAIRGNRLWEFYLVLLLLQTPASLFTLATQWHYRQFMVPQTLLLGALAALAVGFCRAALREREFRSWPRASIAALPIAFLLLFAAFQVRELTAEPTGETKPQGENPGDQNNVAVNEMHNWMEKNLPDKATIVTTFLYSNQLAFLDGAQHRWANLKTCPAGSAARLKQGCPSGKAVTQEPPPLTVQFQMQPKCSAMAVSLPDILSQMERNNSQYLLLTLEQGYPGTLEWAPYLVESGAFKVAHKSLIGVDSSTGVMRGLILLRRTGATATPAPTRMDTDTVLRLMRCERKAQGSRYADVIRSKFPHGIKLEPRSMYGRRLGTEPERNAAARKVIEQIYRRGSTG